MSRTQILALSVVLVAGFAYTANAGDGKSADERIASLEARVAAIEARLTAPAPAALSELDGLKPPTTGLPKDPPEAATLWYARWTKAWSEAFAARQEATTLEEAIGRAAAGSIGRVTLEETRAKVLARFQARLEAARLAKSEYEAALGAK